MGVFSGRDLFSSKWITALITDSSNRLHIVPIKHVIGDYFITDIDKSTYCFRLVGSSIVQYRETMTKTFRVVFYNTTHYRPIDQNSKELELILIKNHLPKVNTMLAKIMIALGKKEKELFQPHNLGELVEMITDYDKRNASKVIPRTESLASQEIISIINYLDKLTIDEIITPLRGVSEFIHEDLLATDPKFMGSIASAYEQADMDHKAITNMPIGAAKGWLKIIAVIIGIGLTVALAYLLYDGGYLDNITGMEFASFGSISDEKLKDLYPDGASMRAAVDSGELDYNKLSSTAQKIIDESPSVVPLEELVSAPIVGEEIKIEE
jgi:hypothetical protein